MPRLPLHRLFQKSTPKRRAHPAPFYLTIENPRSQPASGPQVCFVSNLGQNAAARPICASPQMNRLFICLLGSFLLSACATSDQRQHSLDSNDVRYQHWDYTWKPDPNLPITRVEVRLGEQKSL